MLSLLALIQLAAVVPSAPSTPPHAAAIAGVALASRPRGAAVTDALGAAAGMIETSDAEAVTLRIGARKLRVPANALRIVAGKLVLPITAQDIETLMMLSANVQRGTQVPVAPIAPPKGFVAPKQLATATTASAAIPAR